LVEVHKEFGEKGLVLLYVSRDEGGEAIEAVVRGAKRRRLPFPVFFDLTGEATRSFAERQGQLAVPANVLFDRDHRVAYADVGFTPEQFRKLREAVDRVVRGP
jgi:hypothetical protein